MLMMNGLIPENGKFRSGGVGVFEGEALVHLAPSAKFVPEHIHNLFVWYEQSQLHPLIKSAVFHYELFFWLPIEELIQSRQREYYEALGAADRQSDSAGFVELMLEIIRDSLLEITVLGRNTDQETDQETDQDSVSVNQLLSALGENILSAVELMERLGLSHRPTFRKNYLNPALKKQLIERTIPDKPNSKNQKYRKRK